MNNAILGACTTATNEASLFWEDKSFFSIFNFYAIWEHAWHHRRRWECWRGWQVSWHLAFDVHCHLVHTQTGAK